VRQKAQKSDFVAVKGAHMAPKDASLRLLAPNDAFGRISKKISVFFYFFFLKFAYCGIP
jgi:hypothetical protein